MTLDLILALAGFALVASITPGPNNVMLMTSGANFGLRRTVPHMAGIGIGMAVMILLVGAGLMRLFDLVPASYAILKAASVVYLLWLAWKIAHASAPESTGETARPLTFLQAAAFQWVNPKAWTMGLGAITVYAPDRSFAAVLLVAGMFLLVSLPSVTSWTVLGRELRRWLDRPSRLTAFNWTMAALLVASLYPVVAPLLFG
ncbi:LysE family transporter [Aquicoccus sp. SCR17]|nr:LysE family transporter [Carideicomes alvinocaridis]